MHEKKLVEAADLIHSASFIIILGCPGTGKTTFAKKLSEILNIENVSMDDLYWSHNWARPDLNEFYSKVLEVLLWEKCILDGNYHDRMFKERIQRADVIVLLNLKTSVAIKGFVSRGFTRFIGVHDNLPKNIINGKKYKPKWELTFRNFVRVLRFKKRVIPMMQDELREESLINRVVMIQTRKHLNSLIREIQLKRCNDEISREL